MKKKWSRETAIARGRLNPWYRNLEEVRISKRQKYLLVLGFLFIGITGWLLLFHPFFHVQRITVQGLQRVILEEVIDTIEGAIDTRRYFMPQKNIFLIKKSTIQDVLQTRFPFTHVVVEKKFPGELIIAVEEKISLVIFDNGHSYSYVGLDGKVIEILRKIGDDEWTDIVSTTASSSERFHEPSVGRIHKEMGDYPVVVSFMDADIEPQQKVLSPEFIGAVISWFRLLDEYASITLAYARIDTKIREVYFKTVDGWEIRGSLDIPAEKQFFQLQLAMKQTRKENFRRIDVRYPGKIFWE